MPTRRLPNSLAAVLRLLKAAEATYNATLPADRAIPTEQFNQINTSNTTSLLSRLIKEANEVDAAQALQAPLTNTTSIAAARCTMFVSHFHRVLDLAIARGDISLGARAYYGRTVTDGPIPDLDTYAAVLAAADKIDTGETQRLLDEGSSQVPMAQPSADQVRTARTAFRNALDNSNAAQARTDEEREDVTPLYTEAQALAVDLMDTVEFFYRADKDPASFRHKCRRWGVVYFFEDHETPDPETPTPPPPAP